MKKEIRKNLEAITTELEVFLKNDFSSRFQQLTHKEDRQLFTLASILTKLKNISSQIKEEEKIIAFPLKSQTVNSSQLTD